MNTPHYRFLSRSSSSIFVATAALFIGSLAGCGGSDSEQAATTAEPVHGGDRTHPLFPKGNPGELTIENGQDTFQTGESIKFKVHCPYDRTGTLTITKQDGSEPRVVWSDDPGIRATKRVAASVLRPGQYKATLTCVGDATTTQTLAFSVVPRGDESAPAPRHPLMRAIISEPGAGGEFMTDTAITFRGRCEDGARYASGEWTFSGLGTEMHVAANQVTSSFPTAGDYTATFNCNATYGGSADASTVAFKVLPGSGYMEPAQDGPRRALMEVITQAQTQRARSLRADGARLVADAANYLGGATLEPSREALRAAELAAEEVTTKTIERMVRDGYAQGPTVAAIKAGVLTHEAAVAMIETGFFEDLVLTAAQRPDVTERIVLGLLKPDANGVSAIEKNISHFMQPEATARVMAAIVESQLVPHIIEQAIAMAMAGATQSAAAMTEMREAGAQVEVVNLHPSWMPDITDEELRGQLDERLK